jgi:hypothetical protein
MSERVPKIHADRTFFHFAGSLRIAGISRSLENGLLICEQFIGECGNAISFDYQHH